MNKMSDKKLYITCSLSLLAAAFISGLSFVAQKNATEFVGVFTFNTLRCLIGALCLVPSIFIFDAIRQSPQTSSKSSLKGGLIAGIVLFIAFSINQYSMIYAQASKAGFITSLYIIFVPIIALFLKHKPESNVIISIVLALTGLYLLCAKGGLHFEFWDILLLISAFFFALHIIVLSHYSRNTNTLKLSCIQFLTAGVLSLPLMFIFENPSFFAIAAGYKPILFTGVIVTGVAYTLQIFGHKAVKPVLATLLLSSEAVFALLAGVVLLGETLDAKEIIGCLIMVIAIILSQISIKNKKNRRIIMKKQISNQTFDEERSLYNLVDTQVINCTFAGPSDGESVLKECRNFCVNNCLFSLRYPLWHAKNFSLSGSVMDEKTRAPIWYASDGVVENCKINGIKCLRECQNVFINNCDIDSSEFGWKCKNISISDSNITSEYFLFETDCAEIKNLKMKGKYSFQYMEHLNIKDSELDTKDAFWHSRNVTVENSTVKGEYLGWFSQNLTLINCKIIGTQPLCYCKNLKLINCTMENTDLSFEYSDVNANVIGHIDSVKNPKSGVITADSIGDVIFDDAVVDCSAKVVIKEKTAVLI